MVAAAASGILAGSRFRRKTIDKILRNLEDSARDRAKTKKELDISWFESPILDSLVNKKLKGRDGKTVIVRKTSDNAYYSEEA
jgi:hypothetical protein